MREDTELQSAITTFGRVRPIHKARLAATRLNEEHAKRRPEPMFTLQRRASGNPSDLDMDVTRVALQKRDATLGRIEKASRVIADWDSSDPFAYGRTALHVKQGYLNPKDVVEEFHKKTLARRAARVKEVDDAKKLSA